MAERKRRPTVPVETRLWSRVNFDGPGGCWEWTGHVVHGGYGEIFVGAERPHVRVHRLTYELAKGPIPPGLQIDHLCHNRRCCNPAHLEAVTAAENNRRSNPNYQKTHCKRGHEFTPENTSWRGRGRYCRACKRQVYRESHGVPPEKYRRLPLENPNG